MQLAERMSRIGTESAFEVLARARALEKQGKSIIHLQIGEPDFPTPAHVVEAGQQALADGWTKYGPTPGFPELRESIARYVSTTRGRVKYAIFRDPRAQLLIDDATGFRAVLVPATVEIREDIAAELPRFRAIRDKHGMAVPDDEEHLRALAAEGRVLLAITPDKPPLAWTCWGLD